MHSSLSTLEMTNDLSQTIKSDAIRSAAKWIYNLPFMAFLIVLPLKSLIDGEMWIS